jgi:HAD superfamily hydrolase (TIGR01509 family)
MTTRLPGQRAVIFDLDGVIIHNNEWHLKSWLLFARQMGISLTAEEFPERIFGKTNEQILEKEFPSATAEQLQAWSLEKEALYRDMYAPHFQLADGLYDFLENLKKGAIPAAVASNAPLVNVDFALDRGKIREFFEVVMYAGLVARPKPAPDIYLRTTALLGLEPEQCFVIEDSPTGLEAARQAGCQTIAITSTYPGADLIPLADHIFDHFREIDAFLIDKKHFR